MVGTKDLGASHWAERLLCSLGGDKLGVLGVSVAIGALRFSNLLFFLFGVVSCAPVVVLSEDFLVNLRKHTFLEQTEQVPSRVQ